MAQTNTLDVLVIGAGLSGLQAALHLQEAGCSVAVLEARDRVGGKTHSAQRPDGAGVQEIGAAWFNDTNQSTVWSYCQRFGLTPVVQNTQGLVASEDEDGNCHFFPYGEMPRFEETELNDIVALRDQIEEASKSLGTSTGLDTRQLDAVTFEQWCREDGGASASTRALQTARLWTRGTFGQEPSDVSALAFLQVARGGLGIINLRSDGKHGGQHLRLREGTQSIAIGISKLLSPGSITLDTPVREIAQISPTLYRVTTSRGQSFECRKVIVSIPGPAYKDITFSPPLPRAKQLYTTAARHGCFIKFICLFKTPFWRRQGACGLTQSFRGPLNHCRDTSIDEQGNYALTCFLCATPGRRWAAMDDEGRREAVLKQLGSLFGVGYEAVKAEFLDSITSGWTEDRWAGWGCPFAALPTGTMSGAGPETMREKHRGLFFVGTELADEWRGYMEGALRSGKDGAVRALADLKSDGSGL